jgi:hypothetical protein
MGRKQLRKKEPEYVPFPPGTKFRMKQRDDGLADVLTALIFDGIQYIATNVTDPETGEIHRRHLLLRPGTMTHINQMLVDCMSDLLAELMKGKQDAPIQVEEPEVQETR